MKSFFLITIWILTGLFFAQEALALTISPPLFEFFLHPSQGIEEAIRIFNETENKVILWTSTANFTAKPGQQGVPQFLGPEEKEGGLADWIEIEKGPIELLPLERRIIPFTIKVPNLAEPGGHYGAIFFSTQPPAEEEGEIESGLIRIAGKVASLILLTVAGDIKEEGRLIKFGLKDERRVFEHLPVDFVIGFENLGTVHLKPQGEILIKNVLGRTAAIVEVNRPQIGRGGSVLPGTTRYFEAYWVKKPFEVPPVGLWERLKAQKDNFALGRYRADLVIVYGALGHTEQASLTFWVFPWLLILVASFGLAILTFLLWFGVSRYNGWIVRRAMAKIQGKKI